MRKNGVNREIVDISGGICAPEGFLINAVHCGFCEGEKPDLAVIVAKKKCATAFMGSNIPCCGAPVSVSKRHLQKSPYARALLVNSGVANAFGDEAVKLSERVCGELAKRLKCDASEILIASTGRLGEKISEATFLNGLDALTAGLENTEEARSRVAVAIENEGSRANEFAFSFQIGDYNCKFGVLYKGNVQVCPNMATTLCFITTDVDIAPQTLQKALNVAVNETLNQLDLDGASSPNDCVCIMASGTAGNYRIKEEDSEYKKFLFALTAALDKVCQSISSGMVDAKKLFIGKVTGARSKRAARLIAKEIVGSVGLKSSLAAQRVDLDALLCSICAAGETVGFDKAEITLCSPNGKIVLFSVGERIVHTASVLQRILDGKEVEICVNLYDGNYAANGYSCI